MFRQSRKIICSLINCFELTGLWRLPPRVKPSSWVLSNLKCSSGRVIRALRKTHFRPFQGWYVFISYPFCKWKIRAASQRGCRGVLKKNPREMLHDNRSHCSRVVCDGLISFFNLLRCASATLTAKDFFNSILNTPGHVSSLWSR